MCEEGKVIKKIRSFAVAVCVKNERFNILTFNCKKYGFSIFLHTSKINYSKTSMPLEYCTTIYENVSIKSVFGRVRPTSARRLPEAALAASGDGRHGLAPHSLLLPAAKL